MEKTRKWAVGTVVFTLLAVIIIGLSFNSNKAYASEMKSALFQRTTQISNTNETIKIEIPASLTRENVFSFETFPITVEVPDEKQIAARDYITNLVYYEGNIDFDEVYKEDKYWCDYYNINQNFHLALIYVESKYENGVVSKANCVGLCQLGQGAVDQFNSAMEKAGTPKYYTLEEVQWDWKKNIEVSCWYLDWLWTYRAACTNTTERYIQSYNYGRNGVKRAISKGDFAYADKIIYYRDILDNLI